MKASFESCSHRYPKKEGKGGGGGAEGGGGGEGGAGGGAERGGGEEGGIETRSRKCLLPRTATASNLGRS